jgi:hypothetical protein
VQKSILSAICAAFVDDKERCASPWARASADPRRVGHQVLPWQATTCTAPSAARSPALCSLVHPAALCALLFHCVRSPCVGTRGIPT